MDSATIRRQRLRQQRLAGDRLTAPEEVVGWLAAAQAQDYAGAKWALALRMRDGSNAVIEQAFNEGRILRTHVMRPTWHFVTPDDILWLLELTASRVHAVNAYMYRKLELDDRVFAISQTLMTEALLRGRPLTREEIGAVLAAGGIEASGMRLGYLLMRAELDALICSGPRRGKQFTYMLLSERAPQARKLTPDAALAELTRRYFTGHGPATARDFAWWSGLTLADTKRGLDMVGADLASEEIDGVTYWFSPSTPPANDPLESTFLLPTYDEFLMGFTGASRTGGQGPAELIYDSMIVADGRIVGSWRRTFDKGQAVIEAAILPSVRVENACVAVAAEQFGAFLGPDGRC